MSYIYIPTSKKVIITNHVRFDESYFPYRKQSVIDGHVKERLEGQLRVDSPVTWESHDTTLPRSADEKVHYDPVSDDIAMKMSTNQKLLCESISISTCQTFSINNERLWHK